jgi:hypothetical protein
VELETEAEGVQGVELMWCVSLDSIHSSKELRDTLFPCSLQRSLQCEANEVLSDIL